MIAAHRGALRVCASLPFRTSHNRMLTRTLCSLNSSSFLNELDTFLEHPDVVVIDVRTQAEYDDGHIKRSKLIPIQEFTDRLDELPSDLDTPICVFCRVGQRSGMVKEFLQKVGYTNLMNGMTLQHVAQSLKEPIVQS